MFYSRDLSSRTKLEIRKISTFWAVFQFLPLHVHLGMVGRIEWGVREYA